MKKGLLITIGVIVLVVVILYSFFVGRQNMMVTKEECVTSKWAQVETQYQRRADLIPNLVNTVQGAVKAERTTLTEVMEARARATSVRIDANNLTPEKIQQFQAAQDQLSTGLGRLLAVAENYPQLQTNQNFRDLQAQLESTENRIAVARKDFNESVQEYNQYIRRFPNSLLAGLYGFERKGYFQASAGAENAPKVQF